MTTAKSAVASVSNVSRKAWVTFGGLWLAFGYAIDGTSEVGHHAGLIVGGMLIGGGLARAKK